MTRLRPRFWLMWVVVLAMMAVVSTQSAWAQDGSQITIPAATTSNVQLTGLAGLGGLPVVIWLISVIKPYVRDPRAYPIMALVLGILWNEMVGYGLRTDWFTSLIIGALTGMAASGTYSSAKTMLAGNSPAPASNGT